MADTVTGADYIVSSLPISSIVEGCVDDLISSGTIKKGAIWVDTTSGVPSVSSRIHSKLQDVGVSYLDCGVAGGPGAAEKGTLSAMVGGDQEELHKVTPVLDLMMGKVVHIGPVGSGHAVKVTQTLLEAPNQVPQSIKPLNPRLLVGCQQHATCDQHLDYL